MNYTRIGSLLMDGGNGSSYGAIIVPDPHGCISLGPRFHDGDDVIVESRDAALRMAVDRPHWCIW